MGKGLSESLPQIAPSANVYGSLEIHVDNPLCSMVNHQLFMLGRSLFAAGLIDLYIIMYMYCFDCEGKSHGKQGGTVPQFGGSSWLRQRRSNLIDKPS